MAVTKSTCTLSLSLAKYWREVLAYVLLLRSSMPRSRCRDLAGQSQRVPGNYAPSFLGFSTLGRVQAPLSAAEKVRPDKISSLLHRVHRHIFAHFAIAYRRVVATSTHYRGHYLHIEGWIEITHIWFVGFHPLHVAVISACERAVALCGLVRTSRGLIKQYRSNSSRRLVGTHCLDSAISGHATLSLVGIDRASVRIYSRASIVTSRDPVGF